MGPNTLRLRSELLLDTLRFAVAHSDFYAAHLADRIEQVSSPEDLCLLPAISKRDLVQHGHRMVTSDTFPGRVGLSSGTTFSYGAEAPALAYQAHDEIDLFRRLHSQLLDKSGTPRGLSITIFNATHGDRFLPPGNGEFFAPLEKPFHFAHLEMLLQREFHFAGLSSRVEYIAGDLRKIKLLAFLLADRCPDVLARQQIKGVFTNGDFLTARWRRLLESMYCAPLFDVYGISEIAGATSVQCAACGGFHMPPIVVPEVVQLQDTHRTVSQGFGELILTSLCPFTTLQPLIRYRTGDLVKVLPPCPVVDDVGFVPMGRICKSVIDPDLGVLMPSAGIYEMIDGLPDVSRLIFTPIPAFDTVSHFGEPRYRVRTEYTGAPRDTLTAHVIVELNYDPRLFTERSDTVRKHLRHELSQLTEAGAAALKQGQLALDIALVSPRSLPDDIGLFHGSTGDVMKER